MPCTELLCYLVQIHSVSVLLKQSRLLISVWSLNQATLICGFNKVASVKLKCENPYKTYNSEMYYILQKNFCVDGTVWYVLIDVLLIVHTSVYNNYYKSFSG